MTNGTGQGQPSGTPAGAKGSGLAPNIASLLCYICIPWISIIFLLIEKDNKDVRFHAWQGTAFGVVAYAAFVVLFILQLIPYIRVLAYIVLVLMGPAMLILAIICMVKAYQGERWKIPFIGDFASKQAGV